MDPQWKRPGPLADRQSRHLLCSFCTSARVKLCGRYERGLARIHSLRTRAPFRRPGRSIGVNWIVALTLLALLLFAWLSVSVWSRSVIFLDQPIAAAVHSLASPALTAGMRVLTRLGEQEFLIPAGIVAAALLLRHRKRREAALLIASVLGGTLVNEALKLLFHRARPQPLFGFAAPDSYAFPSGHAVSSVCFYGVLALLVAQMLRSRRARVALWTAAVGLAGLIGLSRVYLGAHYPSDVLGGYALAVVWVACLRALLPMRPSGPGVLAGRGDRETGHDGHSWLWRRR